MNFNSRYNFKTRYYIEPNGMFGWIFRKEGSDRIIKRARYRILLVAFASNYVKSPNDEICICDENGMLVEIKGSGFSEDDYRWL